LYNGSLEFLLKKYPKEVIQMKRKLFDYWLLVLVVAALATVSISSSAMAACEVLSSGVGDEDSGWIHCWTSGAWPNLEGATWIWPTFRSIPEGDEQTYTRTFNIEGCPTSGKVYIACDDFYSLYINGVPVGEDLEVNGWHNIDEWDVMSALQSGINTITVDCENWVGGGNTEDTNPSGLIYKLEFCSVNCDDGIDCTEDSCNPEGGCVNEANDAYCDDSDACNGEETCDPETGCAEGTPVVCEDAPCVKCDPATGECNAPGVGNPHMMCDDGCVNTQNDDFNCGECGKECDTGAGEKCVSGECKGKKIKE